MKLKVKLLSRSGKIPIRATKHAAGLDIFSSKTVTIPAWTTVKIPTDIAVSIETGHYGRIASRSHMELKNISVVAGVIDSDYRGPIDVLCFNHSSTDYTIQKGDRFAQLIIEKISMAEVEKTEALDKTDRNEGGFGSTGSN